ncbi:hypothetical protein PLUTE_a4279 [Pseudoalteromonas luteoviolacea DSM 6061]|nr:hypothetical protein [Pseudoalteromonas luteoviolacea DSM 6061]
MLSVASAKERFIGWLVNLNKAINHRLVAVLLFLAYCFKLWKA